MAELRSAPATQRNRGPILEVLRDVFPDEGRVIELGCGTGEHAAYFARELLGLGWLPTDANPSALKSAAAWAAVEGSQNVLAGRLLDLTDSSAVWPEGPFDAAFSANVIHITPPEATTGLFVGLGKVLGSGGVLVLYGPFKRGGEFTSESNKDFEGWLKGLDPSFGQRDMEWVVELGASVGLELQEARPMPANNFSLVFQRP